MATIITIASQKGGVGKTTTALNLGYSLSQMGKKVLIVDGDPQGGFSEACNLKKKTAKGLLHILSGKVKGAKAIQPLYNNMLSGLGSGVVDAEDITLFENAAERGKLTAVLQWLASGYEYVIIDAPVGVGVIVKALLAASNQYIVVINCKAGTMKTLPRLIKTADWVKKNVNAELNFLGVFVNMYDAANTSEKKIYTYFKSSLPKEFFFNTILPFNDVLEIASFRSLPVAMLEEGKKSAAAFDSFAGEILERCTDTKKSDASAKPLDVEKLENFYSNLLKDLCEKSDYQSAIIADEMGYPIAEYRCPIDPETLAAFTSVLGDCINKAERLMKFEDANNISLEINESDKIALRRFTALNKTYYILVICSQAAIFPGLTEQAVADIVAKLTK